MTRRAPHVAGRSNVPESGVLRACLDLLAAEKIWHMRMNTVGTRVMNYTSKKTGQASTGVIRGLRPGTADILAVLRVNRVFHKGVPQYELIVGCNIVLWIECKSDNGKQTDDQVRFEYEVGKEGHAYLLVRDVDTLKAWLKEHGIVGEV